NVWIRDEASCLFLIDQARLREAHRHVKASGWSPCDCARGLHLVADELHVHVGPLELLGRALQRRVDDFRRIRSEVFAGIENEPLDIQAELFEVLLLESMWPGSRGARLADCNARLELIRDAAVYELPRGTESFEALRFNLCSIGQLLAGNGWACDRLWRLPVNGRNVLTGRADLALAEHADVLQRRVRDRASVVFDLPVVAEIELGQLRLMVSDSLGATVAVEARSISLAPSEEREGEVLLVIRLVNQVEPVNADRASPC